MTPLPSNLQGFLHIITIPLDSTTQNKVAFVCYIRNHNKEKDELDDMILEAIQKKFLNASSSTTKIIYREDFDKETAIFQSWYPFRLDILALNWINVEHPLKQRQVTCFVDIRLSILTEIPIDEFSQNTFRHLNSPDFDIWIRQLDFYSSITEDIVYQLEKDQKTITESMSLPKVIDLKWPITDTLKIQTESPF